MSSAAAARSSDLLDWTLYTIIPTLIEVTLVTCVLVYLYDFWFALITLLVLAPTSPGQWRSPNGARATTARR
jgi:hypothetical protein